MMIEAGTGWEQLAEEMMNDERHRTLTDDRGRQQNASGRQWNVTGRNANDGRAQKERDRVKNDIFTVICPR